MKTPSLPPALQPGSRISCAIASLVLAAAMSSGCAPQPEPARDAAPTPGADTAATAGPAPAPAPDAAATPTAEAAPAPTGSGDTVGGDGSAIALDPLAAADVEQAKLEGELACSFAQEAGAPPILYAMGVVASDTPASGIVKVAGYVEAIRSPGGFSGMLEDPTFTGRGKTIRIAVTGPATGGGESPPRPATLTYLRADGASRTFEGQWQCGP